MPTFRQDNKLGDSVPLIKTPDIGDKQVTERKLADGSVTSSKLSTEIANMLSLLTTRISAFKVADNLSSLPTEENTIGWLVNNHLYVYVGNGSTPESGMYQDCGELRGPQGIQGEQGLSGLNGKSAYDIWTELPGNEDKSEIDFLEFTKGSKGDKGDQGERGYDISNIEQIVKSTEDGGKNIIRVTRSDGWSKVFEILNGSKGSKGDKGTSIVKLEQTIKTTESSGLNTIEATLGDGTKESFEIYNGAKGEQGEKGDKGDRGENGPQGNSGVADSSNKTLVNDAITGGETDFLSAEVGKLGILTYDCSKGGSVTHDTLQNAINSVPTTFQKVGLTITYKSGDTIYRYTLKANAWSADPVNWFSVEDKLSDLSIKQVETFDYPKLQYIGFIKGCFYDDNIRLQSFNDISVEEGLLFCNVSNFTGKKISIQFKEGLNKGYPILAFFNANDINDCNSDTILREHSIFTNITDYLGKEISVPQHAKILCTYSRNALGNVVSVIGQFGSYNLQPLTYINRYPGFIFNKAHEFKQAPNLGTFVYDVSGLKRIVVKSYIDDVNNVENAVQCGFSTMRDIEKTDFISSENVQIKTFYENTFDIPDGAKYFFITTKLYNEIPTFHNVIRIGTPVLNMDIVHEMGEAEDKVMSQKAVSEIFRTREKKKYTINCWGDSLTDQNTWEPYLSQKLSANNINNIVNNYGIGGEATDFICCRIGTFPIYTDKEITINGDSTFDSVPFVFIDNNGQEQTYNIGNSNIRSDRGTSIFHLENDFTVNVSFSNGKLALSHIADTTKKFPKGTIAYPDSIKHANVGDINIFFIGTNGFRNGDGCPKTKDIIANIIDSIKKSIRYCGSDKYLVIGIFSNDPRSISLRDYWDEEFRKTFGNKLIDFRKYVISNGLTDFGLTPTTEDNEAIALGNVPPQLQISDKFHLNDQGGKILAELIYKRIFALGYLN